MPALLNPLTLSAAHAATAESMTPTLSTLTQPDLDDGLCAGVRYIDDAGQRRHKHCSEPMGGCSRIRCGACQYEQESTDRLAAAGQSPSGWRAP